MRTSLQELVSQLCARFSEILAEPLEFRGEITLVLSDSGKIAEVCGFASHHLGFNYLVDLSSVDNYGQDPRWTLVYELYSLEHRCHLRLRTSVSEEQSSLPTVTGVWRAADWHEREIYDLMGICFQGHPDLRRIIMWPGYPYHPLRKDFPLAGQPSEMPDVAFSQAAPLEGGPFVTSPGIKEAMEREPRARGAGE